MAESILKIPKLAGNANWDIWSIRMEAVLTEKGYLDLIINNPDDIMEEDNPDLIKKEKEKKTLAYIRLGLSDGPLI